MRPGGFTLAIVLVLVPLGGCLADFEPESPAPAALPALAFAPPTAMPQATSAAEPNIAILPDGTLFLTAPTGLQLHPNAVTGAAWLWRSRDGGDSWETLRSPLNLPAVPGAPMRTDAAGPFCSCDADVVASPDGWVYYSDWWNGNYLVERSSDGGDSWESSPVTTLDALVLSNVDRQWLVAGPDGFVGLFYAYFPLTGGGRIQAVYSHDHGASWSEPTTVVPPRSGESYQIAHPFLLPDGALVMPFGAVKRETSFWTDPAEVRVAVSRDAGATWTETKVADVPEGFDNLWAVQGAADATGRSVVAWASRVDRATMSVSAARSEDGGASWSAPVVLRADGLNFLPWVAATGDGRVAVGWYGGDATGDPTQAKEDAEWFAYAAESADGGATFGAPARVAADPVKTGPLCPQGARCNGERDLLDYVSLAYAPDGKLHYAFAAIVEGEGAEAAIVHHARVS